MLLFNFKVINVPDPFPIPVFRQSTERNLANKKLLDTDRKYICQTLVTMLMTYDQRPSLSTCLTVARSLVAKYEFLQDNDGTAEVIFYLCFFS